MVCAEEDFRADLLPPGHRLTPLREAISRALARPGSGEAPDDPLGPVPGDPERIPLPDESLPGTPPSPAAPPLS